MMRKISGVVLVLLVAALAMAAAGPKQAKETNAWRGAGPGDPCLGNALIATPCPRYGTPPFTNPCGPNYQNVSKTTMQKLKIWDYKAVFVCNFDPDQCPQNMQPLDPKTETMNCMPN